MFARISHTFFTGNVGGLSSLRNSYIRSLTAFCTRVNRLQRRAGGVSALGALCSVRFIDGARLT